MGHAHPQTDPLDLTAHSRPGRWRQRYLSFTGYEWRKNESRTGHWKINTRFSLSKTIIAETIANIPMCGFFSPKPRAHTLPMGEGAGFLIILTGLFFASGHTQWAIDRHPVHLTSLLTIRCIKYRYGNLLSIFLPKVIILLSPSRVCGGWGWGGRACIFTGESTRI